MSLIDPEISSDPSQGVVMEAVCLDTAPFDLLVTTREVDPNALGLTIALGVTVRVGRERTWNVRRFNFFITPSRMLYYRGAHPNQVFQCERICVQFQFLHQ